MVKNSCAAKAKHYSSLSVSSLKCSPHPTPSSWQHDWGCLPLSSPPGCNRLRARNRKKRFLEQGLSTASVRKCVDRWWKGAETERQLNKSDKRIKQTRSQVEENRGVRNTAPRLPQNQPELFWWFEERCLRRSLYLERNACGGCI